MPMPGYLCTHVLCTCLCIHACSVQNLYPHNMTAYMGRLPGIYGDWAQSCGVQEPFTPALAGQSTTALRASTPGVRVEREDQSLDLNLRSSECCLRGSGLGERGLRRAPALGLGHGSKGALLRAFQLSFVNSLPRETRCARTRSETHLLPGEREPKSGRAGSTAGEKPSPASSP